MKFKGLLSYVLLCAFPSAIGTTVPGKRDALCPGTTYTTGVRLKLTDPTGSTDYGYLTPGVAVQLGDPSYGLVSQAYDDGLVTITSCDDSLYHFTTVTASNAQTNPGAAIGLVAPYFPNSGNPQLGAGSANWVYLAPTTYLAAGSPPEQGYPPSTNSWFESSVWKKNCNTTGGVTKCFLDPTWTNPDGSSRALSLAAVPGSYLVATGDYKAFVAQNGYVGNFVQVRILVTAK